MKRRLGITLGEPLGIGPELILRTLHEAGCPNADLRVYGSPGLLRETAARLNIPDPDRIPGATVVPAGPEPAGGIFPEGDRRMRGEAALAAMDAAVSDLKRGALDALVTAPVDKSVIRSVLPGFTGHTGYLAEKCGAERAVMLMDNTEFRILLLTEHIPLRDVPAALRAMDIGKVLRIAAASVKTHFGLDRPHIAVLGLNPHAGETSDPAEEETLLKPAIDSLRREGLNVDGPFPADSFFPAARRDEWDLVAALYHDQGLIAAKYAGLENVVNITLGLPFLRVSPGHGTAYDLVGRGIADTRSFRRALQIAATGRLGTT